jgi:hypothetical protein
MNDPVKMNATHGTPRLVHLVKIRGALPSLAIPYKVRVAMYWSELAAERVNKRRLKVSGAAKGKNQTYQALMMDGKTSIPADKIATTKGDADAPPAVPRLAACARRVELESTIIPTIKTPRM